MKTLLAIVLVVVVYPMVLLALAWALDNVGVYRQPSGLNVYVGRWACRYSWSRTGMFTNGSRWSSGWHNWKDDAFDAWCNSV